MMRLLDDSRLVDGRVNIRTILRAWKLSGELTRGESADSQRCYNLMSVNLISGNSDAHDHVACSPVKGSLTVDDKLAVLRFVKNKRFGWVSTIDREKRILFELKKEKLVYDDYSSGYRRWKLTRGGYALLSVVDGLVGRDT